MPVFKGTLIFGFTPSAEFGSGAYPGKLGGFSESLWFPSTVTADAFLAWANLRSAIICPDVSINGWRLTPYTILNNNRLIPGKSSVGILSNPGVSSGFTNSPTDTIRLLCEVGAVGTDFELFLHAIPDAVIESARLRLSRSVAQGISTYENMLAAGLGALPRPQWVGRDPTQISQRVQAVNGPGNTITTATLAGIIPGTDFIRLHRVYNDAGLPIKGSFLCMSAAAPVLGNTTYTMAGLPPLVRTTPSGTARVDRISQSNITSAAISSLSSRKVGRPSLLFRGRRSKTRV